MREERKTITALFADLVGWTTLAERLDAEEAREVLGAGIERVVLAVEEFGGTIKDLAGDGVLALFGAPVAHEDDPERAVRAGLKIVEDVAAYGHDLAVRVGIESGLVVLGPVGASSHIEYSAIGDAVNTAARLQAAADPCTVLVGAATQRSIGPLFDWGPQEELELKGKPSPSWRTKLSGFDLRLGRSVAWTV
jgi:class 3 adenylate cyclase